MKSKELRLGNFIELLTPMNPVRLPTGIILEIVSVDYFGIKVVDPKIPIIQQTPTFLKWFEVTEVKLTQKILLEHGFTRHHNDFYNDVIYIKNVVDFNSGNLNEEFEWGIYPKDMGSGAQINGNKKIKYFHHVQNLQFELTGEELIKN